MKSEKDSTQWVFYIKKKIHNSIRVKVRCGSTAGGHRCGSGAAPRLWRACLIGPDEHVRAQKVQPELEEQRHVRKQPELHAEQRAFVWVLQTSLAYQ